MIEHRQQVAALKRSAIFHSRKEREGTARRMLQAAETIQQLAHLHEMDQAEIIRLRRMVEMYEERRHE